MLIVPVFGETIISLIKEVNINDQITTRILQLIEFFEGPFSWLVIFVIIRIIYDVAPSGSSKNRVISYGAMFTAVMWILGTKVYSQYVTNYADYSALYGGIASIVVLMIWMYYLSYIFTIGLALNRQKDEKNLLKNGTIKDKE